MKRLSILGLALAALFTAASAAKARDFTYNAPPAVFGPWQTVNAYNVATTVTITYAPLGSTMVVGEVDFFGPDGNETVQPLFSGVPFRTGPGLAAVQVRFPRRSAWLGRQRNDHAVTFQKVRPRRLRWTFLCPTRREGSSAERGRRPKTGPGPLP